MQGYPCTSEISWYVFEKAYTTQCESTVITFASVMQEIKIREAYVFRLIYKVAKFSHSSMSWLTQVLRKREISYVMSIMNAEIKENVNQQISHAKKDIS